MPSFKTEVLERDPELAVLSGRLERAAAESAGGAILVRGPAGIGKSTLVAVAAGLARDIGYAVASARGGELERAVSFDVARQIVESPALRGALRGDGPPRAAAGVLPGVDASSLDTSSVLHALWWVVAEAAEEQPLLVVVDDAHWSDEPSLAWLGYAARRSSNHPVLILIAARPTAGQTLDRFLGDRSVELLELEPLGPGAVATIVTEELGITPTERFVRACTEATGGNPLYLRELLIGARAQALEPSDAGADRLGGLGTEALARSVVLRSRAAHTHGERLTEAVAVLGEHAELRHAAALAGVDADAVHDVVADLVIADVLAPDPPLRLRHPVLRAAVLDGLGWPRRAALHAAAARLLLAAGTDSERIAPHLLQAEPAGDAEFAAVLLEAGRRAAARGDTEVARRLLRRALAEPPPRGVAATEVELELGMLELADGDASGLERLRSAAVSLELSPARRADAAIAAARAMPRSVWGPEALHFLDVIGAALGDADREARLLVEAELLLQIMYAGASDGLLERSSGWMAECAAGETRGERLIIETHARLLVYANHPVADVLQLLERLAPHTVDDDGPGGVHASGVAAALAAFGRPDLGRRVGEETVARGDRTGSLLDRLAGEAMVGTAAGVSGDLETAETHLSGFLDPLRIELFRDQAAQDIAGLIPVLVARGRLDAAEEALAAWPEERLDEGAFDTGRVVCVRSVLRLAQRRPMEALEDARRAGRILERYGMGACNHALLVWRPVAALAHAALGQREEAVAIGDECVAIARAFGEPRLLGMATRARALVGDRSEGTQRLEESVTVLETSTDPVELARSLVDLGRSLRQHGKRVDAREPLSRALDLAISSGAHRVAEQAREELQATGARPRRDVLSGADALTPAELRIARLAAEGLSNPEVAQALFITRKSVENQLTSVYRKLDIPSRAMLADALAAPAQP